jgi:hypothetical protein
MEQALAIIVEILSRHTLLLLKSLRQFVLRFLIFPIRKLLFPVTDLRTGVQQSRMRYYIIEFQYSNGEKHQASQLLNSNGVLKGYYDFEGNRLLPDYLNEAHIFDQELQSTPERIDWRDVFNGDINSGCFGIIEK